MRFRKSLILAVIVLVAGALACNLPMGGPKPTPAPTDSGFAVPTQAGATAPADDPAAETPVPGEPASTQPVDQPPPSEPEDKRVTLATTDSLSSFGLLQQLVNDFQNKTGYEVKIETGGAGRAFRLGEKYVADVLLVNEPGTEQKYLAEGYAKDRQIVMHTDYVLLGPQEDPAGVKGSANAVEALKKIATQQAKFVSRTVESPVSALEARLWKNAGITPSGAWYIPTEEGVVGAVKIASDKGAYILAARSSFLEFKGKSDNNQLAIVLEGDPALFDVYHVLPGNGDRSPKLNTAGAQAFVDYILSPEAQAIISATGKDVYGEPIFFGDAGKGDY